MAGYMTNSISEANILYTAQNDKTVIYTIKVYLIISILISTLLTIFYFNMDYKLGLYVFIYIFILFSVCALFWNSRFFTDRLFIASDRILIKQNKNYKNINFEDIILINQQRIKTSRYDRMKVIIHLKNGEKIECMNIENFEGFIGEIKKICPSFNDKQCLKMDVDSELNNLKNNIITLIFAIIIGGMKFWRAKFLLSQPFWMFVALPITIIIVSYIPYYIKLKKKEREQIIKSSS